VTTFLDGVTSPAVVVEVDTSLIGGGVWDVSLWDGSDLFDGSVGEWTAVPSTDVKQVSIRRGRVREDQAIQPGDVTVVLDNLSGDYAPDNESSPWRWGSESLMQRGIGVRVRAGFRPAADLEAERLLKTAVLYLDAQNPGSTPTASVKNLGTGRAALNATLGSTSTTDSNDPKWLEYTGTAYCYLPGVASNYLSVPDAAALDITGDIDLRVQVALDDWTPSGINTLLAKYQSGAGLLSYLLDVQTSGNLRFLSSTDGSVANVNVQSTVATGLTDGAVKWLRVTRNATTGDVKFYLSDDGVTWTQLGTTVASAASVMYASTSGVYLGTRSDGASNPAAGKFYRAQVLNGIGGTTVLDIDTSVLTSGAATSFTATTGQTVTINRGTSGRKTAVVTESKWLLGTDDYMEIADNALLRMGASDSFTLVMVTRQFPTLFAGGRFLAKADAGSGYRLQSAGASFAPRFQSVDATPTTRTSDGATFTAGALGVIAGVFDRSSGLQTTYLNAAAGTPVSISGAGSLSSTDVLRIGRQSGTGTNYQDFEFIAAAVFRKALTAAEIAKISTYLTTRTATAPTMTTMFRGYIETVDADLGDDPIATLSASDALSVLSDAQVATIASAYAGDTTAARIGRILDAVNWDATLRSLSGSRTMAATTYGSTALALADEAATCEYGVFYAAKDGTLTLTPYESAFTSTLRFDLADDPDTLKLTYAALTVKPSTEYLVNDVTLNVNGTTVTSQDTYSIALRRKVSRSWTTPLDSLVTAQALADLIVDRLAGNTPRADSIEIDCAGISTTDWGNVLAVELRERLTAQRTTVDGRLRTYGCIIESVNHDITPTGWVLRMNLSPGIGGAIAMWDASLFDGDDRFYF